MLLYLQAIFLTAAFLIGFFIAIPLGLHQSNFDGSCLLFGRIADTSNDGSDTSWKFVPGAKSSCDFCVFSGSLSLVVGFCFLFGTAVSIFKSSDRDTIICDRKSWLETWIQLILTTLLSLLLFTTACLITAGFHELCEKGLLYVHEEYESCRMLESEGGSFYTLLSIGQIAAWLGTAVWIAIAVVFIMRARKMRNHRTTFNKSPSVDQGSDVDPIVHDTTSTTNVI